MTPTAKGRWCLLHLQGQGWAISGKKIACLNSTRSWRCPSRGIFRFALLSFCCCHFSDSQLSFWAPVFLLNSFRALLPTALPVMYCSAPVLQFPCSAWLYLDLRWMRLFHRPTFAIERKSGFRVLGLCLHFLPRNRDHGPNVVDVGRKPNKHLKTKKEVKRWFELWDKSFVALLFLCETRNKFAWNFFLSWNLRVIQ